MKKIILLSAVFICFLKLSYSQAGRLDSSFGTNGIVKTNLGARVNSAVLGQQVVAYPDGSIFILTTSDLNSDFFPRTQITKRHPDGSIDSSYGFNGFSTSVFMFDPHMAVQPDGKIVVAGTLTTGVQTDRYVHRFAIARYNTDGTLDNTFAVTSIASGAGFAKSVAIQLDGKIIVAGSNDEEEDFASASILRYNPDGSLDNTFGSSGQIGTDLSNVFNSVALQPNGKIVAAGGFTLARYNTDGSPDIAFNFDGTITTAFHIKVVALQADGRIIVAGDSTIARYNYNQGVDNSFSEDGKVTTDFSIASLLIQRDGKIIVAGDSALARYDTHGNVDNSFNEDGKVTTNFGLVSAAVEYNNGRILVAGTSDSSFAVARYNEDGNLDNTFGVGGILTGKFNHGSTFYTSTDVQSDGKIVAAGYTWNGTNYDFAIARYNADGSLDRNFSGDGIVITTFGSSDSKANSAAIQSDGKIVVAGSFNGDFAIARFNTDGSLDNTFSEDGKQTTDFGANDGATAIAIQNDGKIVVAGTVFTRYNSNGSPDGSFNTVVKAIGISYSFRDVAIQDDGKIVVAADAGFIARYNSDGSPDKTFGDDGIKGFEINYPSDDNIHSRAFTVAIQSDGKIVVGGDWRTSFTGPFFAVNRYNTDGSPDKSFGSSGSAVVFADIYENASFNSIAIQSDGKIVAAGRADNNFALVRFNADGSVDNGFGTNGIQITTVSGTGNVIQDIAIANNKLYAVGSGLYAISDFGIVARYLLDVSKGKAPKVSLSIPGNFVKYSAPARIKLEVSATDEDGIITKVQFYSGSTLLHTEDVLPYGFLWIDVPTGNYTLTAKAFDNSGNVTTSNSIEVSVVDENVPPIVSIVSPAKDTDYTAPATIRLIAKANDPNDRISKVEFIVDELRGDVLFGDSVLRTEYYYPYTYTWTNVRPGTYFITAKATDDKGLSAFSQTIRIYVADAPIVSSRSSSVKQNELNDALSLRLSPNPTSNVLQIITNGLQQNKQSTISILSASGVAVKTINANASNKVVQLDVSSLVSGVYTLKVLSGDKVIYKQFVKL